MLLDRATHTITVIPKQYKDDGYGGSSWVDGEPVVMTGAMQPMSASESEALGLQANTTYNFITRGPWPYASETEMIWSGPNGEWPGRKWDQVGEANVYSMSRRTRHVSVTFKAQQGVPIGSSL